MPNLMARSFRVLLFSILVVGVGAMSSFAQPATPWSATPQLEGSVATEPSVVVSDDKATITSRSDIRQAILHPASVASSPSTGVSSTATVPVNFSPSPLRSTPQAEDGGGGRRVLYIVGGALVVGGAIAGILALSGGDDGGAAGIPEPPNRPQ